MPSRLPRGDLDQRRGHAAARRIAHGVHLGAGARARAPTSSCSGAVSLAQLAVELEARAAATGWRRRDRRSCRRPGSRRRAAPCATRARRPGGTTPIARGVDEDLVRAALADDLGVAGDDGDAGARRGAPRRLDHAAQVGERQPFLEDEGERQRQRARAADARSLMVPLTASSPMSPPGKKIGVTTYESVVKARRAPSHVEHAPDRRAARARGCERPARSAPRRAAR